MRRAIRRIDPKQAALLLIAAALALAVVPFDRLHAQDMAHHLPAPSGLSATATDTSLTLSWTWTAVPNSPTIPEARYEVKLGADGATTTVSSGTSHTFSGLTAGTSYTLYVRAKSSDNVSDWSSLSAATTPAAPSGLSAAATSASLTLSWTAVTGATGYEVKQGASGAATTVSSGTSHTFSGLTANTSYTLYVRTKTRDNLSAWSSISAATLLAAAPSNLGVTATSASLTLGWWTESSGATGYEVKLGADGATTTVSSDASHTFPGLTADGKITSYTVYSHTFSGLTASTSYTLYVRVKNSDNVSAWSSLSATTLTAGPSGLSATAADTSLTLSWTAVTGATSYEVKQGASGAATTVSSGTSHTFTGLTANTSYTLYARAKNSGGASDWSSLSATTTPAAPSGLSATATSASLTLSWTVVTGATSYEVKQGADGATTTVSSGTSHTFSGLTANTSYTLYARAKNSGGTSAWSSLTAITAPAAPSGLSAAATSASLTLSWTAVTGATSYEVKRGASGAATTVSSGTSHSFSGLSAGANYTLYVRARNSGGASDWSSLTAITAPATPDASLLRVYTDHADVGLEWWRTRVTGATSYEVKLGPRGAVTTPSAPPHGHLFTGLWTVGEEYTLYVRARNSGGASDWAWATIDGRNPPLALTGLSATATSTSLTLIWTSAPSNKTTYEVKLGASGTVATVAATGHTFTTRGTGDKAASELNHTFTGLAGSAEYTLYVRAKNSGGTSSWSSISATTSLAAPNSLSALRSLTLSWDSVPGATSYEVKQGASGTTTTVSSGTSHTFTGLTENTSYTFYVRAKTSNGVSDWSSLSVATLPRWAPPGGATPPP